MIPTLDLMLQTYVTGDRWGNPLPNGLYYLLADADGRNWKVKLLVLR